MIQINLYMHF